MWKKGGTNFPSTTLCLKQVYLCPALRPEVAGKGQPEVCPLSFLDVRFCSLAARVSCLSSAFSGHLAQKLPCLVLHWPTYFFFSIFCHSMIIWSFVFIFSQIFNILSSLKLLYVLKSHISLECKVIVFSKNPIIKILFTSSSQYYLKQESPMYSCYQ